MIRRLFRTFTALVLVLSLIPLSALAANDHTCAPNASSDCTVCKLAGLINALPAKDAITLDNAAAVTDRVHAIDRVKVLIETEEEYDTLLTLVETSASASGGVAVPKRYTEAVEQLRALTGGGSLMITKKFSADGKTVDVSDAEVTLRLTRTDAPAAPLTLTLSTMAYLRDSLSADSRFYSANADGWQYTYRLSAGTYRVEELSDTGATVNGAPFQTGAVSYTVNGQSAPSGLVTVKNGEESRIAVLNARASYDVSVTFQDPDGNKVTGARLTLDDLYRFDDSSNATVVESPDFPYMVTVTAPAGYFCAITNLTFDPNMLGDPFDGADLAAQGVAYLFEPHYGMGNDVYQITVTLYPDLAIVSHPQDATAFVGETATFSVTARGADLTYQWQIDRGNGFEAISGAASATYETSPVDLSADGYRYRCAVSGRGRATILSDAATLTVTDAPIPETGDTSTPILFAAIAAIAAIALIKRRAFAR